MAPKTKRKKAVPPTTRQDSNFIKKITQEIPRSKINDYLGRETDEDSELDPTELISVRAWMEEEGYEVLKNKQMTQTEVANLFGLSSARISTLFTDMKRKQTAKKVDAYRRKLGPTKTFVLKKSGEENMSEENVEEEELDLSGDEQDLIELMHSMGVSPKVQTKVITFYKKAPQAYAYHQGLYQLLVTCGVKADWARNIVDNYLYMSRAPTGLGQGNPGFRGNMPMGTLNPYGNPYQGNPNTDAKKGFSSMFEQIMMAYFSKIMGNMMTGDDRRGPVPYVASEIVQKPIIGPDGKIMVDKTGNMVYETTTREKPLSATAGQPVTQQPPGNVITPKDFIEFQLKFMALNKEGSGKGSFEKELYKEISNKLERVEGKLSEERMAQLQSEIVALRNHDPVKEYIALSDTFKQITGGSGNTDLELEKIRLNQALKLKELEMTQGERTEARELVEGLRQSFDTGIVNVAAPLVGALAAGVEKSLSEPNPTAQPNNAGGDGGIAKPDFANMSDNELQQYMAAIDNAKINAATLEHDIVTEVHKRNNYQRPDITQPVPPATPVTYAEPPPQPPPVAPAQETPPQPIPPPATQHVDPIPLDENGLPKKNKRRFGVLTARGDDDF